MTTTAEAGAWRGVRRGSVSVFRGIRYATADRFAPPQRTDRPAAPADATQPGPIAPQSPSRLAAVMGEAVALPQSEDCLRLTVTTPDPGARDGLPVLVWIHGGAYLSGSGEWNVYSGERLSAEGSVVVVSVSYRLGALGFLRAPGIAEGNLGLYDQIAALEWVQDNIPEFGGDPARVTVAGQSAGAQSAAALLGVEGANRAFGRAVLQSAPMGLGFGSHRRAERVGKFFLDELGEDPHSAPVGAILAAQGKTSRRYSGPLGLRVAPAFFPVVDAGPIPTLSDWGRAVDRRACAGLDVILGTTENEMKAFRALHPVFRRLRRIPLVGGPIADLVERLEQNALFDSGTWAFADRLVRAGAQVYPYRLAALDPRAPFGATHCIDLPLLLGDEDAWRSAPMLRNTPAERVESAGTRLRASWSQFVGTGVPHDERWRRHIPGARTAHRFPEIGRRASRGSPGSSPSPIAVSEPAATAQERCAAEERS